MPIDFLVTPEDDWGDHRRQVKTARGTVCYGALAAHFGTESPKALEWRVDRRRPYDCYGDLAISNKFLRWRQGKALPHDDSVANIALRTAGSVRLGFWRELPLWDLLTPEVPPLDRLHKLLEQAPMNIRRILFSEGRAVRLGRFHHSTPTREQILGIRNLHSLDAFITLLCLARKGEALEDDPQHFLPSACAFDIFPRILYSYSPLRYRWGNLFGCIYRLFWNRIYLDGLVYQFSITEVRDRLALLVANPAAVYPRVSGKRLRTTPHPLNPASNPGRKVVSVT